MTQKQLEDIFGELSHVIAVSSSLNNIAKLVDADVYGKDAVIEKLSKQHELLTDAYYNIIAILSNTKEGKFNAKKVTEQLKQLINK